MPAARSRSLFVGADRWRVRAKPALFFTLAASRADEVLLECERFRAHYRRDRSDPATARCVRSPGARNPSCQEKRCFDRLTLANAMSAMNRRLRNSEGTSIIVGRLDRAKAEHEECNRRKGAACAVNSEKIQGLSLHALQPSGLEF
jgi:hypothetical protein